MKIELHEIPVRELVDGYKDCQEEGVVGYGGRLNIRPPYQREFIYKEKERNAVIETVQKGFPLNVMYWCKNGETDFEVLDGQQRTISLCQYVVGDFSVDNRYNLAPPRLYFHTLPDDKQEEFLDYKLMVYFCEGTASEKLNWFETINIAGAQLTKQELRNAVHTGTWLADAKKWFSKTGCPAYGLGEKFVKGSPIRQEILETAIDWISDGNIDDYMGRNQHVQNANELWLYFQSVIQWVAATFPKYRKEMKGLRWGGFYNVFKNASYNTAKMEARIAKMMADEDVQKKSGIYEYVLTGDERCLNIRAFLPSMKREAYERQGGTCPKCGQQFAIEEMEGDHITPWSAGGKTVAANCQMLCKDCNRAKGAR